mgnify:CR=1 FL=1
MKSLVAILFLINCLAFFMLSHMQKQSELKSEQAQKQQNLPLSSPQPVVLLSELSADQLQVLSPDPEKTEILEEEQLAEPAVPVEVER